MTNDKKLIEEETVKSGDRWIWGIYISLCIISVIETYSAMSQRVTDISDIYSELLKHVGYLFAGFVLLWIIQRTPYQKHMKFYWGFYVATFIAVYAAFYIGADINGAKRSIRLGPVMIQPAEMAKFAIATCIPMIISKFQTANGVSKTGTWAAVIAVCALAAGLFVQGLSNSVLLAVNALAIMLIGGIKFKRLAFIGLIFGIFLSAGYGIYSIVKTSNDHRAAVEQGITASQDGDEDKEVGRSKTHANRISRWWSNRDSLIYRDPNEEGGIYKQEMFSRFAVAKGGLIGVGPGNSEESSRLPLAYLDYVYSIIVEETGLIGGVLVIFLYLWLVIRAGYIAYRCGRTLPALLIMGMAMMITTQALMHIAINAGVMPVSGQSLPLISTGGSSMVIISSAFGIMLCVSRHASQNTLEKMERREAEEAEAAIKASDENRKINIDNEE